MPFRLSPKADPLLDPCSYAPVGLWRLTSEFVCEQGISKLTVQCSQAAIGWCAHCASRDSKICNGRGRACSDQYGKQNLQMRSVLCRYKRLYVKSYAKMVEWVRVLHGGGAAAGL